MNYRFFKNTDGIIQHEFDDDHALFGYWLVRNYQDDPQALKRLLALSDRLATGSLDDYQVSANSYYLQLTREQAKIIGLSTLEAPEDAADNRIDFDNPLESTLPLAQFMSMLSDFSTCLEQP